MSLLWVTAAGRSVTRYVDHNEIRQMYSGDFDVPMHKALGEMHENYVNPYPGDGHHEWDKHGGPRGYVDHLAKDISANGIHEPISVRGGNVITDGHHRALAAMKLRMKSIPVHDFD